MSPNSFKCNRWWKKNISNIPHHYFFNFTWSLCQNRLGTLLNNEANQIFLMVCTQNRKYAEVHAFHHYSLEVHKFHSLGVKEQQSPNDFYFSLQKLCTLKIYIIYSSKPEWPWPHSNYKLYAYVIVWWQYQTQCE